MNINDYSFHDSQILSVTEFPETQNLEFHISYPENCEQNLFVEKRLLFHNITYYCINEIPFANIPTILELIDFGEIEKKYNNWVVKRKKVEFLTNAGKRTIEYEKFEMFDL